MQKIIGCARLQCPSTPGQPVPLTVRRWDEPMPGCLSWISGNTENTAISFLRLSEVAVRSTSLIQSLSWAQSLNNLLKQTEGDFHSLSPCVQGGESQLIASMPEDLRSFIRAEGTNHAKAPLESSPHLSCIETVLKHSPVIKYAYDSYNI